MTTIEETPVEPVVEVSKKKLAKSAINFMDNITSSNPWSPSDVDKLEIENERDFYKIIDTCRFFYKHDPIASSVINKMVDIAINDIVFNKNGLTENEFRVFLAIKDKLKEFSYNMALEYLISGLVVPEIVYEAVPKNVLKSMGIKNYSSLILPTSMYLRDPKTIKINQAILSDKPSYFLEVPAEVIYFITHKGMYSDGTKDTVLYEQLLATNGEFVKRVQNGERYFLLENKNIQRRRVLAGEVYPLPFMFPAIEAMKHKRNLRRMDYSIAARVISAVMLVKLGSDEFPVTEDEQDRLESIKSQMLWRNSSGKDVERIFQLFADHTLNIEWIFPPVDALLNDAKYKDINQDIIFAFGFPRILITGESEKTGTSDPQYASMSPVKTMEAFRNALLSVLKDIVFQIAERNSFKNPPIIIYKPLQLSEFQTYVDALGKLYDSGNLSRTSFAEFLGYNFLDELDQRIIEQKLLVDSNIPEFAPAQHSNAPTLGTGENPPAPSGPQKPAKKPAVK